MAHACSRHRSHNRLSLQPLGWIGCSSTTEAHCRCNHLSLPLPHASNQLNNYWTAEEHHQRFLERGGRYGQGQSAAKSCNDPIRCMRLADSWLAEAAAGRVGGQVDFCAGGAHPLSCVVATACSSPLFLQVLWLSCRSSG